VSLEEARTQKPHTAGARPRAAVRPMPELGHEQASTARCEQTSPGATDLFGQALARENMAAAWKRVKSNKGSAGVDGRTVQDTGEYLKSAWADIRAKLLDGSYRPDPVRRVGIPKPGGGTRELGYLQAGILEHGVSIKREGGTPQGGPLSPLLRALRRRLQRLCQEPEGRTTGTQGTACGVREAQTAGQRSEDGGGIRVGAQVPGLLHVAGQGRAGPTGCVRGGNATSGAGWTSGCGDD